MSEETSPAAAAPEGVEAAPSTTAVPSRAGTAKSGSKPSSKHVSAANSRPGTGAGTAGGKAEEKKGADASRGPTEAEMYAGLVAALATMSYTTLREYLLSFEINERFDIVNLQGEDGKTAIFHCMDVEQVDSLQLLLDYGADPQHLTPDRNTPLHEACARNNNGSHKSAIQMIIFHGGDIQVENMGYYKCHQMAQGESNKLIMMNWLNTCVEKLKGLIKDKLFIPVFPQQRSYLRGIYDVIDAKGRGIMRFEDIYPFLGTIVNNEGQLPHSEAALAWFQQFDNNHNGICPFDEFVLAVTINKESGAKKGKKGGKGKKKK